MVISIVVPKKIKNRNIIWSNNSTYEYLLKSTESRHANRYLYTHIHSYIIKIAPKQKQPKYSLTDEWISKVWYTHTMDTIQP